VGVVEPEEAVVSHGQEHAALQILEGPMEPDPAMGCIAHASIGGILREHGPSLGKTTDRDGESEPVILTSSRILQRGRTFD
jgi:hypothetical protein